MSPTLKNFLVAGFAFTALGNDGGMGPRLITRLDSFLTLTACERDAQDLKDKGEIEEAFECLPQGRFGFTVVGKKPTFGPSLIMRLSGYPDFDTCDREASALAPFIKRALPCSSGNPSPSPTSADDL
jgi:hypothetical protein